MPFVQGHLRREPLTVTFRSECAHCSRPLAMRIDSDLGYDITTPGAVPLVFLPLVNFAKLKADSIIDDF
jgi:hypothetical protein